MQDRWDVLVVGAGMAGLTAAAALAEAGQTVVVHEARDRVGGRARSVPAANGTIDLGATWYWPNEPLTRSLVARSGLTPFTQFRDGDALFEPTEKGAQRLNGDPLDGQAFRLADGTQQLALELVRPLPPGALRLNEPATAVTVTDDGVEIDTSSGRTRGTCALVAMPPALAVEQITFTPDLPRRLREAAEQTAVWMGGVIKAVAVFDDPFWRSSGLSGSAISYAGPFREFHDHSGPDGAPPAIFGFAPALHFGTSRTEEVAQAFQHQLVRLFGAQAGQVRSLHIADWNRETFTQPQHPATGAAPPFGTSDFQQPLHGKVHWASTEIATSYAGHIEGALHSGLRAADAIKAQLSTLF